MRFFIIILIILIIILLIGFILKTIEIKNIKDDEKEDEKEVDTTNGKAEESKEYPYERTLLLTKNEWRFYKNLKPITDKYNLHILAKVRFADLVIVKKELNKSESYKYNAKIRSKHVDFVIANPENLAILCIIELDDNSHNKIDRQKRDFFIDKVCETVKLPIIHCKNIEGIEDEICKKIKIHKK